MKEILLTIGIFSLFSIGILSLLAKWIFDMVLKKIKAESLTPDDIRALQSASDDLVKKIDEAANAAINRIEAKEAELKEFLRYTDKVILSSAAVNRLSNIDGRQNSDAS